MIELLNKNGINDSSVPEHSPIFSHRPLTTGDYGRGEKSKKGNKGRVMIHKATLSFFFSF